MMNSLRCYQSASDVFMSSPEPLSLASIDPHGFMVSQLVAFTSGHKMAGGSTVDVNDELAQKERDLILAAELGKALLHKSELLQEENAKIQEKYLKRIELMEQEKHELKKNIEVLQEESDQRILELQSDLCQIKAQLHERELSSRLSGRQHQDLLGQLTEQNQRLTTELQSAAVREERLQKHLADLKHRINDKCQSMQDHNNHLDMLKEEISLLTRRKNELEKRIDELLSEKSELNCSLDETMDKIMSLEKHVREQDTQLQVNQREISELRSNNHLLNERLISMTSRSSASSSAQMSLLDEMEMSTTSASDSDRSLYRKTCFQIDEEIEDIEEALTTPEVNQLKEEMLWVQEQLDQLCQHLRHSSDASSSSSSHKTRHPFHPGVLKEAVLELKFLMYDVLSCQEERHNESQIVNESLQQAERDIKMKNELIEQLTAKVALLEVSLSNAKEENQVIKKDLSESCQSQEEVVKKAWEARDVAMSRKNSAEMQLAQERLANMQINSQLLEAIQQKIELSQQLEQWQTDMEQMLQGLMRQRLNDNDQDQQQPQTSTTTSTFNSTAAVRRASRIINFFK